MSCSTRVQQKSYSRMCSYYPLMYGVVSCFCSGRSSGRHALRSTQFFLTSLLCCKKMNSEWLGVPVCLVR